MKIYFIGIQGSGKSTQAHKLASLLKLPIYGLSDMLRQAIIEQDPNVISYYNADDIKKGILAPDHVINYLLDTIEHNNCIIEGALRTVEQAKYIANKNEQCIIIELTLPKEVAVQRALARGRIDDTLETINVRINKFEKYVEEIRRVFKKTNYTYCSIDASADIESVFQSIIKHINM